MNNNRHYVILKNMVEEGRDYELTVILSSEAEEKTQKDLLAKIKTMIKKFGGQANKVEEWGKRKFAYPINHKEEGVYYLFRFKLAPEEVVKLKDKLRLEEKIIRFLLVSI